MRVLFSLAALLAGVTSIAGAAPPKDGHGLADIAVIPIHDGANVIPHFAADGRPATIFRAWRDNGNAHGHDVYLVTLPLKGDDGPQNTIGVVTFNNGRDPVTDTATASPFDGERVVQRVLFAHARLYGEPATVMILGDLGESKSGILAEHALASVSVYVLRSPGVSVGTTPDVFKLAFAISAFGQYCNADMALHQTLGVPLPTDYAGGKAPSGCLD